MHRLHEIHWTEQLLTEAGVPAATVEERAQLTPAEKKDLVAFLRAL